MFNCPLCCSKQYVEFHKDKKRTYLRCSRCLLVFVSPDALPTPEQELAEYRLHQNTLDDTGYLTYLSRLVTCISPHLTTDSRVLDYGSGPCPALAYLLNNAGYSADCYDPFFGPYAILQNEYDLITATESIEHFHTPATQWQHWMELLAPAGWLAIMTKRVLSAERFANWHYKNDPTHVSFFSVETFTWLARQYQLNVIFPDRDIVLMQKLT